MATAGGNSQIDGIFPLLTSDRRGAQPDGQRRGPRGPIMSACGTNAKCRPYVTATTLVSIVAILALLKAEIGFVENHDVMPKTSMWRTQVASRCGRCRSKAPGSVVTQDGRCQPANNRRRAGRARASRAVRATLRGQQQAATCWRPERALASAGGGNFAEHLSATYGAGMALIRATCVRPRKSMRRLIGTFRCSFLNSRT
jgi:hypothetical protein